jgi:hypothetical protein
MVRCKGRKQVQVLLLICHPEMELHERKEPSTREFLASNAGASYSYAFVLSYGRPWFVELDISLNYV